MNEKDFEDYPQLERAWVTTKSNASLKDSAFGDMFDAETTVGAMVQTKDVDTHLAVLRTGHLSDFDADFAAADRLALQALVRGFAP